MADDYYDSVTRGFGDSDKSKLSSTLVRSFHFMLEVFSQLQLTIMKLIGVVMLRDLEKTIIIRLTISRKEP